MPPSPHLRSPQTHTLSKSMGYMTECSCPELASYPSAISFYEVRTYRDPGKGAGDHIRRQREVRREGFIATPHVSAPIASSSSRGVGGIILVFFLFCLCDCSVVSMRCHSLPRLGQNRIHGRSRQRHEIAVGICEKTMMTTSSRSMSPKSRSVDNDKQTAPPIASRESEVENLRNVQTDSSSLPNELCKLTLACPDLTMLSVARSTPPTASAG